ncbi:MAG: UDP-glucose 4-epimerase [Candidatus Cloacimonas sp. 4484_209]|nr:MAG: UDP-glucose 4-epimerase [Candidatus Cloacimonas sp. 4484_209]
MERKKRTRNKENVLVTGVAGFIGSHLCEKLLNEGYTVIGIDSFTDFYPEYIKLSNIKKCLQNPKFRLLEMDILELGTLPDKVEFIFHTAAQAGVRTSWGKNFEIYTRNNVLATQHLLELSKKHTKLKKFIYSSSSSIYGDAKEFPTGEDAVPSPVSPYGVTKLAGEHLCQLYHKNFGVPVISLRYFTVFGPRQRPDMAFHKFIKSILLKETVQIFGDGKQSRDFTYVSDVVNANILAMKAHTTHTIFNIGGGNHCTINDVLALLKILLIKEFKIQYSKKSKGDVKETKADITRAQKELGFFPKVDLESGLRKEIEWIKKNYGIK